MPSQIFVGYNCPTSQQLRLQNTLVFTFLNSNCDKYSYILKKSSHLVLRLREPEVAVEDSLVGEAVVGGHLDCGLKILSLNVCILVSLADAGGGLK